MTGIRTSASDARVRHRVGGDCDADGRAVVHLAMRAQRAESNLALDAAIETADALGRPVVVLLRLGRGPDGNNTRHVHHMASGLADLARDAAARNCTFVLAGYDAPPLAELLRRLRPCAVTGDEDAMPAARATRDRLAGQLAVPYATFDVDVVVPSSCFPKQQWAARTLRPRLHRVLHEYDGELGAITTARRPAPGCTAAAPAPARLLGWLDPSGDLLHAGPGVATSRQAAGRNDVATGRGLYVVAPGAGPDARVDADAVCESARAAGIAAGPPPVRDAASGRRAGLARLRAFATGDLRGYATRRNAPELDATSRISSFLHYGHLGPAEVVAAVRGSGAPDPDIDAYVEELVVRRELSVNYLLRNPLASSLAGAPDWSRRTLEAHARDVRPWLYDEAELDAAQTHDPLWNAAQRQLVARGHMHGYVRMYWGKKLLEWSPSADVAFDVALRLNDRYELDGRDPNGVVGVAWSIAGVHDRPWTERPIFGTVRYMSLASTGRKFDSKAYIARWDGVGSLLD